MSRRGLKAVPSLDERVVGVIQDILGAAIKGDPVAQQRLNEIERMARGSGGEVIGAHRAEAMRRMSEVEEISDSHLQSNGAASSHSVLR